MNSNSFKRPQGEAASGWYCEYLVVAEDLVNSLAEKFTVPLQVNFCVGVSGGKACVHVCLCGTEGGVSGPQDLRRFGF